MEQAWPQIQADYVQKLAHTTIEYDHGQEYLVFSKNKITERVSVDEYLKSPATATPAITADCAARRDAMEKAILEREVASMLLKTKYRTGSGWLMVKVLEGHCKTLFFKGSQKVDAFRAEIQAQASKFLAADGTPCEEKMKALTCRHGELIVRALHELMERLANAVEVCKTRVTIGRASAKSASSDAVKGSLKMLGLHEHGLECLDPTVLKKAFREKCLQHHPDKGGDADKFKAVTAAFEFIEGRLSERGKRPCPQGGHDSKRLKK